MAAAYPFEGTICYSLTIPELCAEHDQGGGVACGHDFIVFTRYQIPDWYLTKLGSPELQDELTQAALAVEAVVSFYMSRSDLGGQGLRSLPTRQSLTMHEIDKKPWFFLNAAKVDPRGIGIAGRGKTIGGTLVETLLAVLSRPWCILELCYSTTSAVYALLDFANLACQLDVGAYTPARILLSHEIECRSDLGFDVDRGTFTETPSMTTTTPQPRLHHLPPLHPTTTTTTTTTTAKTTTKTKLHTLLTTLFIHPEDTYSGFWMRAICISSLRLNLSVSVLGSALADSTGAYAEAMSSLNLLRWGVERYLDERWTLNHRVGDSGEGRGGRRNLHDLDVELLPSFEEGVRAESLKESFLRLGDMFALKSLPELYKGFMREIGDLA